MIANTGGLAHAAKPIPAPPADFVLDEPQILSGNAKRGVEKLLTAHSRTTGEQVVVAIFNSLDGEDLVDFTARVFKEWKIGQRGKDNGVLLALYWNDRKARIEVGYGLEPVLTDAKSKLVLNDRLIPALQDGQIDLAISSSVVQILTDIGSPLIENGEAQEILKNSGYRPAPETSGPSSTATRLALLAGIIFLILVLNFLTAADAHYTRNGWTRSRPWRGWPGGGWGGPFGGWGGGLGGGGFGGGGFSGGGGRSGGGGASGSW